MHTVYISQLQRSYRRRSCSCRHEQINDTRRMAPGTCQRLHIDLAIQRCQRRKDSVCTFFVANVRVKQNMSFPMTIFISSVRKEKLFLPVPLRRYSTRTYPGKCEYQWWKAYGADGEKVNWEVIECVFPECEFEAAFGSKMIFIHHHFSMVPSHRLEWLFDLIYQLSYEGITICWD